MTVQGRALGLPKSRSDAVRARRASKGRKVERGRNLKSIPRRRVGKPRKRVDISLSHEKGTTVQLPALPSMYRGARMISALLLMGIILLLRALLSSDVYLVGTPSISGTTQIGFAADAN